MEKGERGRVGNRIELNEIVGNRRGWKERIGLVRLLGNYNPFKTDDGEVEGIPN